MTNDDVPSRDLSTPTIRGIALDMDGLLFDTERLYWSVGDTVLRRRGFRYTAQLQQRMMGRVGTAAMDQMIQFHSLDDSPEDLLVESEGLYAEQLVAGVDPMPGLDRWIGHLIESDVPFGLATSSRRKFVEAIFASVDWANDLSFVLTGDDVVHGKPHPEMYLKAAQRLAAVMDDDEFSAAEMLVLEDSGNGCAAAVAAGACVVAIPNEHTRTQNFDGAALVADSLADPRLWAMVS